MTFPGDIALGQRLVGRGRKTYVIAEVGVNHDGDVSKALAMVDSAALAGADAVKFQLFEPELLVTAETPKAAYQIETTGSGGQLAMLRALALPIDAHAAVRARCEQVGVEYLCTPYDDSSLDALVRLGVQAIKVASTDVTNIPFLERIAAASLPIILSTGMADLSEVARAVEAIDRSNPSASLALLQCTSCYPAPDNAVNLGAIRTLADTFGVPTGFSDHTTGLDIALLAVAAGACLIEKHVTYDRAAVGPDHRASLAPEEFEAFVRGIRRAEQAMGDGRKRVLEEEASNKVAMQRSLVFTAAVRHGEIVTDGSVGIRRPALGLPPEWISRAVGSRARRDVAAGEPVTLETLEWSTP